MSTPRPQTVIADEAGLTRCAEVISRAGLVALDTESNGFHAYFEKVCLVQLACAEEEFAVDVLAVGLGPLLPLLADPARELILHAAEFDVLTLRRDYGLRLGRLFDTHAAAKVLGIQRVGLGNLLEGQLEIRLEADEQKSDWGKRPLSAEQLAYAFADVHHLIELREKLLGQLREQGRLAEAEAEFERLRLKEPKPRVFDPEGWQRMKTARTLSGRGRAVLRALYLLRDQRARELDRPPFKVISDLFLGEVAHRLPKSEQELSAIPGASPQQLKKIGAQVIAAVEEGLKAPAPDRPRQQQGRGGPPWKKANQDPAQEARYEALRAWRKERALVRKVEVQVIAPNAVLMELAKARPSSRDELGRIEGMDAFRLEQYGDEMLRVLAAAESGPAPKPPQGSETNGPPPPAQGKLFD